MVICLGVLLYTENVKFKDDVAMLAVIISVCWPIYLVACILLGLGHCIKLLLIKIFGTK